MLSGVPAALLELADVCFSAAFDAFARLLAASVVSFASITAPQAVMCACLASAVHVQFINASHKHANALTVTRLSNVLDCQTALAGLGLCCLVQKL
jgi:hypothetical protein